MADDRQNILLLVRVVQEGDIHETDRLLGHGHYINCDEGGNINAKALYRNLLMLSIDALQEETAIYLINQGINLNHRFWGGEGKQSARDLANENGLLPIVQLIDSKLPVSQQLFYAVSDGSLENVKQLAGHIDADMNMKVNLYGEKSTGTAAYTLLLIAAKNGHEDVAVFLVEKGIDSSFKHQVWEQLNPESEAVLVESFDALKLATQNNLRTLEQILMAKQNAPLVYNPIVVQKENAGYTNHERSSSIIIGQPSENGQSESAMILNVDEDQRRTDAWEAPQLRRKHFKNGHCVVL